MFNFDLTDWYEGLVPPGIHEFELIAFECDNDAKTINMSFVVDDTDMIHDERFHLLTRVGKKNRKGITSVLNMLKAIYPNANITNITDNLLGNAIGKKFIGEIAHNKGTDGRTFANFIYYKYSPVPQTKSTTIDSNRMKELLEDEVEE